MQPYYVYSAWVVLLAKTKFLYQNSDIIRYKSYNLYVMDILRSEGKRSDPNL